MKDARGFTLVEVLVAAGLTGFVLTAVAGLIVHAAAQARLGRDETRAALAASDRLEELLRAPLAAAQWSAGTHTSTAADGIAVRWVVAVDVPGPGARTVAVSAGRAGSARRVRMVAVRSR